MKTNNRMMMKSDRMKGTRIHPAWTLYILVSLISLLIVACGNSSKDSKSERSNSTGIAPCELLTPDQLETILPGHDEGFVAHAGGSLIKGVDSYQCSYSADNGGLFTVILTVAVDDKRFEKIKPDHWLYSKDRKVNVGAGGWLFGEEDDMKLKAVKGHTVIKLELLANNAKDKADALIELASAIAQKIK